MIENLVVPVYVTIFCISSETNNIYVRIRTFIGLIHEPPFKMNLISRAEELLLLAIWTLQDQSYGAMLRDYLVEATDEDWSIGVVYNTLDRLARKGFVRTSLGDPTPERGGRAKRYFHLTAEGVESLERIRTVQNSLWSDLPILNLRNA